MVTASGLENGLKRDGRVGKWFPLRIGTLFLPEKLPATDAPLFVHFHGGTWIPEIAATKIPAAVIAVQLGARSATHGRPFAHPEAFGATLAESRAKDGRKIDRVVVT